MHLQSKAQAVQHNQANLHMAEWPGADMAAGQQEHN
jgi:hypothetical protein